MNKKLTLLALGLIVTGTAAGRLLSANRAGAAPAPAAKPVAAPPGAVTFTKDVAPIVFNNCAGCHHDGEVAPFPLTTYAEVKKHAKQIADVTGDRVMPPWKPVPGHGDFVGERRLTEPQIKTLAAWSDAGAPEGDAASLPPLPKFGTGWVLGEPDLVVKMPQAYTLRAEGRDVFRCFVLPLDLPEDKYVTAVDFRPGNPKIVHHALFFLDNTGQARKLDADDPDVGYGKQGGGGGIGILPTGGLGGWSPGYTAHFLPDGVGRVLKKGSDLVIQEHLHPSGKTEQEQSTIALYFAKKPPEQIAASLPKFSRPLNIPAGEKNYVLDDTFDVPMDVTLMGITPHAHLLCKEIKADATLPDGQKIPLIWIKDWDWNWQDQYLYQKPIRIPHGTKIDIHYVYDNSVANVRNPTLPPKRVTWGEQTTDEMAIIFFQLEVDRGSGGLLALLAGNGGGLGGGRRGGIRGAGGGPATQPATGAGAGGAAGDIRQRLLERFDKNHNGKLDPDEQEEMRQTLRKELGGL